MRHVTGAAERIEMVTIARKETSQANNSKLPGAKRHCAIHLDGGKELRFELGVLEAPAGTVGELRMGATVVGIGSRNATERLSAAVRVEVTGRAEDTVAISVRYASQRWEMTVSGVRRVEAVS